MRNRDWTPWLLLAAALIVGLLALWLINGYLSSRENQIRLNLLDQRAETRRVVVATRDLQPGDVVSSQTFSVAEMPAVHVPARAVTPDLFDRANQHVLTRSVSRGEMLQADFVAGLLVERFSGLLAYGERAVSVEVSSAQAYSGMLLPGDYIDLYVSLPPEGNQESGRLVPVLERVKVLAAGSQPLRTPDQSFQRLSADGARYSLITVGLPREKAERLELARQAGDIVFLLRNADDRTTGIADAAYEMFDGDNGNDRGYWYISNGVPMGERRTAGEPSSPRPPAGSAMPASNAPLESFQSGASSNAQAASIADDSSNGAGPPTSPVAERSQSSAPPSTDSDDYGQSFDPFEMDPIAPVRNPAPSRSAYSPRGVPR